jgi:hypothetical protein
MDDKSTTLELTVDLEEWLAELQEAKMMATQTIKVEECILHYGYI